MKSVFAKRRAWLAITLLSVAGFAPVQAADIEASVAWSRKTALSIPVSGLVTAVEVAPGQSVKKDQVLLQLDQGPFETAHKKARATLDRQRVILKAARRDRDQAQELYERQVSATLELDQAKEAYQRALAEFQIAEAALQVATYQLEHSTLKAPFDGWVLSRHVEPGQTVVNTTTSTTLIVMAARGEYIARALLPADRVEGMEMGKQVRVEVRGKSMTGRITHIGLEPAANKDNQRYQFEVNFSSELLLRAGEKVTVEVN